MGRKKEKKFLTFPILGQFTVYLQISIHMSMNTKMHLHVSFLWGMSCWYVYVCVHLPFPWSSLISQFTYLFLFRIYDTFTFTFMQQLHKRVMMKPNQLKSKRIRRKKVGWCMCMCVLCMCVFAMLKCKYIHTIYWAAANKCIVFAKFPRMIWIIAIMISKLMFNKTILNSILI